MPVMIAASSLIAVLPRIAAARGRPGRTCAQNMNHL
jgi:hypothetical protein